MRALLALTLFASPAHSLDTSRMPISENVELAKADRLLVPAIVVCMSGTGMCITYRLDPVATFDQCQGSVVANANEVQAKFEESWIYGFECS